MGFFKIFHWHPGCKTYVQGRSCLHGRLGEQTMQYVSEITLAINSKKYVFQRIVLGTESVWTVPTIFFLKNLLQYFDLFYNNRKWRFYGVVHKWRHTLTGGGGHQICDKLWQGGGGGVSSFVMLHESFWYACYTQSYQKGKVWRSKCSSSIYNSFWCNQWGNFVNIANGLIVFVVYFQ